MPLLSSPSYAASGDFTILGTASQAAIDHDSELRVDFVLEMPSSETDNQISIHYDWDGNGTQLTASLMAGPGVGQEFQVIDRRPIPGTGLDRVYIALRGDLNFNTPPPQPPFACPGQTYTHNVTVSTPSISNKIIPVPVRWMSFNAGCSSYEWQTRIPWDNLWNSADGNSQDGFSLKTSDGIIPADKVIIAPDDPNSAFSTLPAGCPGIDQVYYQVVHQDGTPDSSFATPKLLVLDAAAPGGNLVPAGPGVTSSPFPINLHDADPNGKYVLPATQLADGPGYYKVMAWADSSNPACASIAGVPTQVGSMYWIDALVGPDTDSDGIPDATEGTGDPDGDGIPNFLDTDSDGDGIPDATEGTTDTDGDGIPNYLDTDSDGDGIPDATEGTTDTDGDGIPNYLDTDSDADGIPDATEGTGDSDGDGIPNYIDPIDLPIPMVDPTVGTFSLLLAAVGGYLGLRRKWRPSREQ
ncbi:thrombospondin type 3 repeat-containing protein [Streptomyces sp. NPDC057686]|uniref:thrombospondin type 3 repeat-containing protein n=1 Tax=Streptomyces sp. NPDC057686 TaxID=3346212 RepID=UPI0036A8BD1B